MALVWSLTWLGLIFAFMSTSSQSLAAAPVSAEISRTFHDTASGLPWRVHVSVAEAGAEPTSDPYAETTQSGQDGDAPPFFFALDPLVGGSLAGAPPATGTADTGPCEVVFEEASTSSRRQK